MVKVVKAWFILLIIILFRTERLSTKGDDR